MATTGSITYIDYSLERGVTSVNLQDVSAVNYGSVSQDLDEIKDAIATMTNLTITAAILNKTYPESGTVPTDPKAQRESKWVVYCMDTTQFLDAANTIGNPGYLKKFSFEIPGANVGTPADSRLATGTDIANLAHAVVAAFKTAVEANVRSPWNGSANTPTIQVQKIVYVGRNT